MRGVIVYEPEAAAQQTWYINEYIRDMAALGHGLSLVTTDRLPEAFAADFAIIRTMDPAVSAGLEERGIRCFNNAEVCALSADKGGAYDFIARNTLVPFMPLIQKPEYPFVLKKKFCHGGTDVHYITCEDELISVAGDGLHNLGDYILQQPCDTPGIDVRVYILGGRIRATMRRENPHSRDPGTDYRDRFRSNFCLGGTASVYDINLDTEMFTYVNEILSKLDIDFAGIDFIFHEGHPVFNELESVAGTRMLYAHTDIDIVREYCEYICEILL